MQEAFAKLKGVDIFSLKSYMEPTNFGSFNGAWVLINELFVNLFFFILNAVVGFFSLLIRILEKIDLYTTYKTYVFHGASSIWHGFTGSNTGNITNKSLVGTLLLVLAFYLFYQYFLLKRLLFKNTPSCLSSTPISSGVLWDSCWNFWWSLSP